MLNSKILFSLDYIVIALAMALAAMGVIAIWGATLGGEESYLWIVQLRWVILGFLCLIAVLFVDYRSLIRWAPFFYALGIFGLLLCFTPLAPEIKGARSWIKIGGLPQFQPSEFSKLATALMLVWLFGKRKDNWNGFLDLFWPLLISGVPALLTVKQGDIGGAMVFAPIALIVMFVAGMPYTYLLFLCSPLLCFIGINHDVLYVFLWIGLMCFLILMALVFRTKWSVWIPFFFISLFSYALIYGYGQELWDHFPNHAKSRLIGYWNPEFDIKDTNHNIYQSKIALGSGGFWGKGLGRGTQSQYGFLPEYKHDFVFSVMGEQVGFLGGIIIIGVFLLLLLRGLDTAMGSRTMQGSLTATGVIAIFFTHILVNIGMVTGLLPVTGLPLTFISYGGSFMLCNMIGVGLLANIRMRSSTEMMENSFLNGRSLMDIPTRIDDDF
ncbi:MAG: FtsW/RodA/SpoVE family cell cycle protein [Candidatus Omnitrophota bacterium]